MKILVDSYVWSLALRRRPDAPFKPEEQQLKRSLEEAIEEGRVATIGPIRQELLSGVRDTASFERLRSALAAFPDEPLVREDFEEAAACYNLCQERGLICGPIDLLICAVALRRNWSILTSDSTLKRCQEAIMAASHGKGRRSAR